MAAASLPYQEPTITIILTYSSFFLAANVINAVLDKMVSCGLVGQIVVGITWGTPGGRLFGTAAEGVISNLGYLGLILLVYEGHYHRCGIV